MKQELPLADELAGAYARMSGLLLSQETVRTALDLVTTLAAETVPGSDGAGVTLVDERGRRSSRASTDARVGQADALQYELDQGPCLTAAARRSVVRVDDVRTDGRWPEWCRAVEAVGVRSAVSAPLVAGDRALGAIKVYASQPGVYDSRSERLLSLFAAQAAVLVHNVQSHERARQLSDGLKAALTSRDRVATATGVLMGRDGLDSEAAFVRLAALAQQQQRALHEVAVDVVRSAERRRPRPGS